MPEMDYNQLKNLSNATRKYRSGAYYGPDNRQVSTVTTVLNTLSAVPFWVANKLTIDRIACEVTTAGTAGATVTLAIYNSTSEDFPASLLLETSAIDSSVLGVKESTVSFTFSPGLYWLALVSKVANCTVRSLPSTLHLPPIASSTFIGQAATLEANCYNTTGVSDVLPSNWSSTVVGAGAPKILVRAV